MLHALIKILIKNTSFQSNLSTEIVVPDDYDEEKVAKKDFLLACVLVGEYLSEKGKTNILPYKMYRSNSRI